MPKLRVKIRESNETRIVGEDFITDVYDVCNIPLLVVGRDMMPEEIISFREEWNKITTNPEQIPLILIDPNKDISLYEFEVVEEGDEQ